MAGRRMQTEIPEFMHRVIGDGREEIQEGGREGGILYILLEISNPAGCGEEDVYTCTQRKEKTLPLVNFSQSAFFFIFSLFSSHDFCALPQQRQPANPLKTAATSE